MKPFTAAVVQAAPVGFDVGRTLVKLRDLAADAARAGAALTVFPEAFVSAYPRGLDFGARVGSRTPAGREMYRLYYESAIDVPGPAVSKMAQAAADGGMYLVVGVIERAGGTLYCSVLFFGPDGRYLGKHRKLIPTAAERVIWGRGDGSTLPVFDTTIGKLGAVVCWENYMPLLRTAMYAKGIELYCAPTADGRTSWIPSMQHIAFEGRCFVLSCNQFARRRDYPDDYPLPPPERLPTNDQAGAGASASAARLDASMGPDDVVSNGGSVIVGPLGEILAGPNYESELILTATIDRADIGRAKLDLDVIGHYARPDVFELTVDERPRPGISTIGAGSSVAGAGMAAEVRFATQAGSDGFESASAVADIDA